MLDLPRRAGARTARDDGAARTARHAGVALVGALRDAWAVLMPIECAGCDRPDRSLCDQCVLALAPDQITRRGPDALAVFTSLRYESTVRRVILAFKQRGRTDVAAALSAPFAVAIATAVAAAQIAAGAAELASIPSSRRAYRGRGYDPVALLLRTAGLRSARVLTRGRRTGIQKDLALEQRTENLHGAFVASRSLVGRRFVIVDDVMTSGATLGEAARAIRAAGGEVCGAATLAYTPRLLPIRDIAGFEDYGG